MSYGVGQFANLNRRTVRAPINPMDKSTIVSVYPKDIIERKHSLEPGVFIIPAADKNNISILVVGPSSWWKDVDPEQPLLEITNSSMQVANSIIRDWANGLFMCNMGDSMPGLFYVPGELTREQVIVDHFDKIKEARAKQKKWFENLAKAADILWARTNGNPLAISDDARLAVQELQIKDKPWMRDFSTLEMINCPYCGSLAKPGYPVCAVCGHVVDEKLYAELEGLKRKVG